MKIQQLFLLAGSVSALYTPQKGECPSYSLLRPGNGLLAEEKAWVSERQKKTKPALEHFLNNQNYSDFDVSAFLDKATPKLAIANSGGGLRATFTGLGTMQALDNRTESSAVAGFLQATDYMSGLSGGSWLVGFLAVNDFPTLDELYHAFEDIFKLPGSMGTLGILAKVLIDSLQKLKAGYQTTVTDQWGRLIYFLLGNAGLLKDDFNWSELRNVSSYVSHDMPFPIILGTSVFPGTSQDAGFIGFNNSIVEMTPYEFGTWDKNIRQFIDMQYLGTEMENGKPVGKCTTNFDNAGLLMGFSSNIFNIDISVFGIDGIFGILVEDLLKLLEIINDASYRLGIAPNPYYKMDDLPSNQTISKGFLLCDGGYDLETIPILPFLQPEREVDVVIAMDPSQDTPEGWPTGEAIRNTMKKSNWEFGEGVFPVIPENTTFIEQNLTTKPVFFGCNTTALKKYDNTDRYTPVLVYVPMHNITWVSNYSTGKLIYSKEESYGTVNNAYNMMTRTNLTEDANWGKCLGCASILRELQRLNETIPGDCQQCFSDYCYN